MPINYLILKELRMNNSTLKIYKNLKKNLSINVIKIFKQTKYFYENYNPIEGFGNDGYPFCGWSCLIILIINEKY